MKTLVIDMPSGVAGDMLLAALLDLGVDRDALIAALSALGIGPVALQIDPVTPQGLAATRVTVVGDRDGPWLYAVGHDQPSRQEPHPDRDHAHGPADGHHHHRPYAMIRELITGAALPQRARERAAAVFRLLAEAEATVHGLAVDAVQFHEVGSRDAIVDVVGTCLALELLGVDRVVAGPLTLGSGVVDCAHGRLPVPVPAVAEILRRSAAPTRRVPGETGELTTPTGAALVCALTDGWEPPGGRILALGYGAGSRVIPGLINVVRATLVAEGDGAQDEVVELRCQVDDATGESLGCLLEDLLAAGALDAYLSPILMKKGRPGSELTVLANPSLRQSMEDLMLTGCSSIGLRWQHLPRRVLSRHRETVTVAGQEIGLKVVDLPGGGRRARPEADEVRRLATVLGDGFDAAWLRVLAAWEGQVEAGKRVGSPHGGV